MSNMYNCSLIKSIFKETHYDMSIIYDVYRLIFSIYITLKYDIYCYKLLLH